ncbi:MAG: hydroxyacid dehydrogenase [Deltaproteobacteria bacterium]|nr:hydroxyacid dehydrogenase [Deltaproteobacteria bacterium]
MKILIADKLDPTAVEALTQLGTEVRSQPDLKAEDLPEVLGETEVLVVRSTKVKTPALAAAPKLSLVVRAGAGVNTIDVAEASHRGIYVANCPGKNTAAVAELALGLIIAADRQIVGASNALRAGEWKKKEFGKASGLKGRTLGLLGVGQIGVAVARRAQGLGMEVMAWSRSLTPERAKELGLQFAASPIEVAQRADVISVHLASTPQTRHLVDASFFAALKTGAIFVNTSRGELVDTEALREAILPKSLRVGLDVFENEPAGGLAEFEDTALAGVLTATPHIGASTDQAAEAIAAEVVRIISLYKKTGKPPNTVNMGESLAATHSLSIRHFNRVGVLATVLDALKKEDINIQEMENTIFQEGRAAFASLLLDRGPSDLLLKNLRAHEDILQIRLSSRS